MPFQAFAQAKRVGDLVVRDAPGLNHLRLDLQVGIQRKQRVVNHVPVIAHDVGRGPYRIDDFQIRVIHHAQCDLGEGKGRSHRQSGDERKCTS
jgi:hypothetical protein